MSATTWTGVRTLFRQFSTPGGVPSHVSVQTPGSIHEGGELGLRPGARGRRGVRPPRPDRGLRGRRRRGRDRAARGVLEAAGVPQPAPGRRRAADPAPQRLQDLRAHGARPVLGRGRVGVPRGQGWDPVVVAGDDPREVFPALYAACSSARRIRAIQARPGGAPSPARLAGDHPAHAEGLDRPGRRRRRPDPGHLPRPPGAAVGAHRATPSTCACSRSGCGPTRPRRCSTTPAALVPELARPRARGRPAHVGHAVRERWPAAGGPAVAGPGQVRAAGRGPGVAQVSNTVLVRVSCCATCTPHDPPGRRRHVPAVLPGRDGEQPAAGGVRGDRPLPAWVRCWTPTTTSAPDGRVMEVLSEHLCQGWLEGYLLTGRHGVFATYEAFAMVSASMVMQHAKWLQHAAELPWRAPVASLNVLLTSTCWRNDHNGFSHQGPGLIDTDAAALARRRPRLAAAGRQHDPVDHGPLPAQQRPREPDRGRQAAAPAVPHAGRGRTATARPAPAIWDVGRAVLRPRSEQPDIVLACAGDVPTQEALAAAELLRDHVPYLRVRFVNVVDLMALLPENDHPHGFSDAKFDDALHRRHATWSSPSTATRERCTSCIHGRIEPGPLPRPRLQRAGHHDDALRHGGAQPDDPLSTSSRRRCAGPAAGVDGWDRAAAHCRGPARRARRRTSASTSRTCPTSPDGPGGAECALTG